MDAIDPTLYRPKSVSDEPTVSAELPSLPGPEPEAAAVVAPAQLTENPEPMDPAETSEHDVVPSTMVRRLSRIIKSGKTRSQIQKISQCDICEVNCGNPEALESHKKGKRHKRTLQNIEATQKRLTESQAHNSKQSVESESHNSIDPSVTVIVINSQKPVNESRVDAIKQLEMIIKRAGEQLAAQRRELELQSDFVAGTSNIETMLPLQRGCEQGTSVTEKVKPDTIGTVLKLSLQNIDGEVKPDSPRKRKNMAICGEDNSSNNESVPKRLKMKEQPITCTFCNLTCITRTVLDSHLAGKKHAHRFKPYQGKEAMYGPLGYFRPVNQQISSPSGVTPLLYGFQSFVIPHQEPILHDMQAAEGQAHSISQADAEFSQKLVSETNQTDVLINKSLTKVALLEEHGPSPSLQKVLPEINNQPSTSEHQTANSE